MDGAEFIVIGRIDIGERPVEFLAGGGNNPFKDPVPRADKVMGTAPMKLTIVIPAYNEEEAIGSTIERCLAARETIVRDSPVTDVEIVVVSDGSTDRTAQIAAQFDAIKLVAFDENRGYGAAIKKGFEVGSGELLGFLDADGTCDPAFFATLCAALIDEQASVAIGSRMGPRSHMPRIRRIGNRVYAFILSALSNQVVTDAASGMRVLRREVLSRLLPLPEGLHFTPAMSARVLMDDQLSIIEREMPYEERVGESKLHVVKDGFRFLLTILQMTLVWKPARLFLLIAGVAIALMLGLALHPLEQWVRTGRFEEGMIYRLLLCSLLGTFAAASVSAGVILDHLRPILDERRRPPTFFFTLLNRLYSAPGLVAMAAPSVPLLAWLIGPGVITWIKEGAVHVHWSRAVLAGLILFGLGQQAITLLIVNVLRFHTRRSEWLTNRAAAKEASAPAELVQPLTPNAPGEPSSPVPARHLHKP